MKMRKNKFKLFLALAFTVLLMGCNSEFEYQGERPELYSVAISSVIGVRGYMPGGFHGDPPFIDTLERDIHGRVLFNYSENRSISRNNLVIMQRVDGDYAYFYPHYNFISINGGNFANYDIESLKVANSWNQPMSENSELVRVRIVRQRDRGSVPVEVLIEVDQLLFPDANGSEAQVVGNTFFLRTDDYGRSVYFRAGVGTENLGFHFVTIFQPDHSFDLESGLLIIENSNNSYQTELRLWMEANGWNTPWEE